MSESGGILLSGIGQSLIQFADIQHDTKISALEAEAQRQKEIRLQEMRVSRDAITDSFRLANLESSQERLRLAQETSNLAQEKFDYEKEQDLIADYDSTNQNVYGHYYEEVEDPLNPEATIKKQQWGIVGQRRVLINKKDPDDIRILNMDGTMTRGTTADLTAANASAQPVSGTAAPTSFGSMSELEDYIIKKHKDAGESLTPEHAKIMAKSAVDLGRVTIGGSAAETTSAVKTTPAGGIIQTGGDASLAESNFQNPIEFKRHREEIDKHIKSKMLSAVYGEQYKNERITELAKEYNVSPEEMAGLLGYVVDESDIDIETRSAQAPPIPRRVTTAPQVQADAIVPGGAVIDAAAEASDPATIASEFGGPVVVQEDQNVFAYDAAKSKAFIEGLIKEMQTANISQEDIRKELLLILGGIPKEQANGDFAKAVANAYYEFTKGTN